MKPRSLILPAAALALNAVAAVQCHAAAVDYFLKLDGIEGESTDSKHKGEIEISSFSWGVSNTTNAVGGGGGAGKPVLSALNFTKRLDKTTPVLFLKCASGVHFKHGTMTIVARFDDGEDHKGSVDLLTLSLDGILVSSVQENGAGDLPVDSVSLNFAKVSIIGPETPKPGSLDAAGGDQ